METIFKLAIAAALVWCLLHFTSEIHDRAFHHQGSRALQAADSVVTWLKYTLVLWIVVFILLNGVADAFREVVRAYDIPTDNFDHMPSTSPQDRKEGLRP